jgi:MurNAc alpha-1-phosphate uridylyltransferase
MLLAAGRGERMRPLTDRTPKPLLEAGGKPLIVWHIEKLVHAGICELVINHAHLGTQIETALGDGSRFGAHIRYSPEGSALETAGGIANALSLLHPNLPDDAKDTEAQFAVISSDIFCDYDFSYLPAHARTLQSSGDMAHLVLVNNPQHHPDGDFALSGNRIYPFQNTSLFPAHPRLLTFSGIGIYQHSLFKDIPRGSIARLAPLLHNQIVLGKVSGEHYQGCWTDVGTPERLAALNETLLSRPHATHSDIIR